jgi:hypothetical protein
MVQSGSFIKNEGLKFRKLYVVEFPKNSKGS